jgi:trimeric autotransporter adhesin
MTNLARTIAALLATASLNAHAEAWTYRGTLQDGGAPANGRYDLRLSLLQGGSGKAFAYPLTFHDVQVRDGVFAVDVDFGRDLANVPALELLTEVGQRGAGFVALGEPTAFDPKATLAGICWDTTGNSGNVTGTNFIGNIDAVPLDLRSSNIRVARLWRPNAYSTNVVLGGSTNVISAGAIGASILGGGQDDPSASVPNKVSESWSTVCGGQNNVAGNEDGNPVNAQYSTVGGGFGNVASGYGSSVLGGYGNYASGYQIGYGAVGGGSINAARGDYSIVPGGYGNDAGGDHSFAAGRRAKVRDPDATGESVAACGGNGTCGDEGAFVWADAQNESLTSSGPNQFLVRAQGGVAINGKPDNINIELTVKGRAGDAFGGNVDMALVPSANGTSVEGYHVTVDKGTAAINDAFFEIANRDSTGNYYPRLSLSGTGLVTIRSNTTNLNSGVTMAAGGGSWSSLSDRREKTAVEAVDPRDVLARVVALPMSTWQYRAQDASVRHMGPMAQDFRAAFALGENDTTISTVDADGVALAAIQGLNAKLEFELQASREQNALLHQQLAQLAGRLAALEAENGQ